MPNMAEIIRQFQTSIFYECRGKNAQQGTNKPNLATYKNDFTTWPMEFNPGIEAIVIIMSYMTYR